jgi:hypothetical protein
LLHQLWATNQESLQKNMFRGRDEDRERETHFGAGLGDRSKVINQFDLGRYNGGKDYRTPHQE